MPFCRQQTGVSHWTIVRICRSGSVRSSHQNVSDYILHKRFPNTQQSRFLTACRRLEKLVLSSIFDTSLVQLAVIQQQFWTKECDILGVGLRHTLIPPTYFQGVKTPNPMIYAHENASKVVCSTISMQPGIQDAYNGWRIQCTVFHKCVVTIG